MINLGEEVSKEQVDDVIAAFDEDGDGEISPDECVSREANSGPQHLAAPC